MIPKNQRISIDEQGHCELSGDVSLKTVGKLYEDSCKLFAGKKTIAVDFLKISSFDSAIISLILSWLRLAQKAGHLHITFQNIPDKLEYLIKAYRLDEIIRINS